MKEDLEMRAGVYEKIKKRRQHFVMFPMSWDERLVGATGQTYRVAVILHYLRWRNHGAPVKLTNCELELHGVSRQSKWRALGELERRGLITVERRPRRSPLIHLLP